MSRISKTVITIVMIIVLALSYISEVNAASATASLALASGELKAGTTVTITLNISGKIKGFEADLDYDTSVFEEVTASAITGDVQNTSKRIVQDGKGSMLQGNVTTITLKVKNTVSVNSTTVRLKNVEVSTESGNLETINSPEVVITGKNNATPAQTTKPNTTSNPSNVTTAKKANISNLPKAGLETGIVFVVAIGAVAGIIFYAKYKNIKKYDK